MTIERIDLEKSKPNKDFGMSVTESLDALYCSETYAKLCDPAPVSISRARSMSILS